MKQLNGLDTMFMGLDTAVTSGVLGGLVIYDPPAEGTRGPDEAFMRARITERLEVIPPLRWVKVKVPLGMDHDYLAEAHAVDVHAHVHTIQIPEPGTEAELAQEVSRLKSTPLPSDRPLWDYWILEGLADGRSAHLMRIHHGVLDGGSMPILFDLLADEPATEVHPAWRRKPGLEPLLGTAEMAVRGVVANMLRPLRFAAFNLKMTKWAVENIRRDAGTTIPAVFTRLTPGILAKPGAGLINLRQRRADQPEVLPLMPRLKGPATPFNQKVTQRRNFVFTDFSLDELKGAGKPFGATLNDVIVAVCAGAVRRFLTRLGSSVDEPIILCVPVGLRDPKKPFMWGNEVSMIFADFPVHLEDPVERLAYARTAVQKSKANFDMMPLEHLPAASRFMPQQFFSVPSQVMAKLPGWVPSPATWNVIISNVRGPAQPVYVAGSRVQGYWPASFLSPIGGLNITLQSYVDRVDMGIVVCTDHVDDLSPLVTYLHEGVAEIVAAAKDHATLSAPAPSAGTPAAAAATDTAVSPSRRKATTKTSTTKKATTNKAAAKKATTKNAGATAAAAKRSAPRRRTAKTAAADETSTPATTAARSMHVVKSDAS